MASSHDPHVELSESDNDDDVQNHASGQTNKRKENDTEREEGGPSSTNKKQRSWVWDHFTKQEKNSDKSNCNYCLKELCCPSKSGTSAMKRHLEIACKAYKVWDEARRYGNQNGVSSDGRVVKVNESVWREASNEMIVLAELPLAFIECLAWKHFCSKVQMYRPHSRRTATRDIVEIYVQKKAAMKKILGHNQQRVSLTTDIWVASVTGSSYMVVTAHFVDSTWKLRKMIIGFKNIVDHKGGTICNVLLEVLAEWDIKRVFCITVDNATANSSAMMRFKAAMKLIGDDSMILKGEHLHLRCATHILNLIVKEGLIEVDQNVVAIRNGIQFVRSSTNRLKSFDFRVETGKVKRGSLPLDVKTRWNSTYLMLEQALKFRNAFEKMEAEDKPYNDYFLENVEGKKRLGPPSKSDWDVADRLVQILVIFYKSTLILSASTSVACHKIYNEIVTITRNISALSTSPGPDEELKKKATSMLVKLNKYWDPFGEKVEMNRLVIVASVFDPRKKMKFAQLCFDTMYGKGSTKSTNLSDSVNGILKDLFDEYTRANILNKSSNGGSSSQSQGAFSESQEQVGSDFCERTILGNGLGYERMESIYDEILKETGLQNSDNELESYLKEKVENPKILMGTEYDLLAWWKVNSGKYPILSLIAKDMLVMQVPSVASESAFSTSGRILNPFRSCLQHYMIEVLMCTEQWLKCEIHINEKGVSTIQQLLAEVELEDALMREFEP